MYSKIKSLFHGEIYWKYILSKTLFKVRNDSRISLGKNISIKNSSVTVLANSELIIEDGVNIKNIKLSINGKCILKKGVALVGKGYEKSLITINNGSMYIGANSKLEKCTVKVRFGGELKIGDYTNINEGTEIRCDSSLHIGDFNQISYHCNLWDTNTHNIYEASERRDLTTKFHPKYGYEFERPKTSLVKIGNDCWVGKNVSILKGTEIGDKCIIGYGTVVSGDKIGCNKTIVSNINNRIIDNNI